MAAEPFALWVLIGACVLHLCTVAVLIRRVRQAEKPFAWHLLGLAVGVLAMQQSYGLYVQYVDVAPPALNVFQEILGLLVAVLILGGIVNLSPILNVLTRNKELLEVIDERNVIICQFHDRIFRNLRQVQMALEVGKPTNIIIEQVAEMAKIMQVFLEDLKAGVLLGSKFEIALKTLVDDMSKEGDFPIIIHVDSLVEDSISYDQGAELLHIFREALSNCIQYSQAKTGKVLVRATESQMIFEVSDNGKGFEFDLVAAQGHGLGNMAFRAKEIGASLKVQSQPNKGTTILLELPRRAIMPESQDSLALDNTVPEKVTVG